MPRARRLAWLCLALLALNGLAAAGLAGLYLVGGAACASLGLVACLLGVRHAFDADHIAAIDNVTRRLRQLGHRPVAVGLFFSLGHSAVVVAMTLALVLASRHVEGLTPWLTRHGLWLSALVSALFLTAIGAANLRALRWRARRREQPAPPRRIERAAYSRAMFPLGLLFGLNLDTAGEILLLATSAAAIGGAGLTWWVMAFPLLFTAGMAVADSCEGLLMLRLYDWALADRDRSLRLNTATTVISAGLALAVAGWQWTALARAAGLRSAALALPESGSIMIGAGVTVLLLALWGLARLRANGAVAAAGGPGVTSR